MTRTSKEEMIDTAETVFIKNPLPLPKKHEKKTMEYDYVIPVDKMKYDYEVLPNKLFYDL
ncbi:MAG: hypothetical protein ACRC7V_00315 [Lachnospiraceae bacterium]